ncbi:MAG: hypothetical protein WCT04_15860 [Planctomycetota bacterium]
MAANETRITRLTRAIGSVTTIFRCHGLQMISPTADRIGGHDLIYWIGFLLAISAWYLFGYMPQCRRYEKLAGRQQVLTLSLETEKKELGRLRQGIASLQKGDALAWERATRKRLGWLEPGEVLDVDKFLKSRNAFASAGTNPSGIRTLPRQAAPTPVLPRPRVPQIPHPQQSVPSGFTNIRAPILPFADSGALGPAASLPPPAPHVPVLPQRPSAPFVQRVSVVRPVTTLRQN